MKTWPEVTEPPSLHLDAGFGHRFLSRPGAFPQELEGESWGEERLALRVAAETLVFDGLDRQRFELLAERFKLLRRRLPDLSTAIETRIFRAPESDFLDVDPRTCGTSLDARPEPGGIRLAGLGLIGRLEIAPPTQAGPSSPPRGALWLPPSDEGYLYMAFENYLRVALAYRLAALGGALVHSAAVVKNARAHLFFGHSGAGKSTLARQGLRAGLEVLSDDFNLLWPLGGEIMVCQLPYAGEFGRSNLRTDAYPLGGVFRLSKSPVSRLQPLGTARTVAGLLACCPFVNGDPVWRERTLANLTRIARATRTGELSAAISPQLWELF